MTVSDARRCTVAGFDRSGKSVACTANAWANSPLFPGGEGAINA